MTDKPRIPRAYFAAIGKKGGKKMTAKKLAALKRNARKPRPGRRKKH